MKDARITAYVAHTTIDSICLKSSFTKDNTYYYEFDHETFK